MSYQTAVAFFLAFDTTGVLMLTTAFAWAFAPTIRARTDAARARRNARRNARISKHWHR